MYRRFGGPDVVRIEQVPQPVPADTEVLIRVQATTVSAADRRARSKDVPRGLALPSALVLGLRRPRRPILGMDVAGVVESTGSAVTGFVPGDEVVAMLGSRFSGHAEFVVADASSAIAPKPAGATFAQAAALVFGGITARGYLNQARLEPGVRVLVNGASGAVGSAAVQLCRAAGAHVTAVTSAGNAALVRSLGADRAIDYRAEDFAAEVFSAGGGYDIVMDCVGNAPVARVRPVLNAGAAVLLVAADLRSVLAAAGQARRNGWTVTAAPGPYRAEDLEDLGRLVDEGQFRPLIDRSYPLEQIAAAHRFVDTNRKRGAVVINVG